MSFHSVVLPKTSFSDYSHIKPPTDKTQKHVLKYSNEIISLYKQSNLCLLLSLICSYNHNFHHIFFLRKRFLKITKMHLSTVAPSLRVGV
jgi:hypothetical protein